MAHERLGIVDPESGHQPLLDPAGDVALAVNGEIYNHRSLRREIPDYAFTTASDCEVNLAMYPDQGEKFVSQLDGMFAFVLSDSRDCSFFAARDHMGIVPLCYRRDANSTVYGARVSGFELSLPVDGYTTENSVSGELGRRSGGCWGHVRRGLFEAKEKGIIGTAER